MIRTACLPTCSSSRRAPWGRYTGYVRSCGLVLVLVLVPAIVTVSVFPSHIQLLVLLPSHTTGVQATDLRSNSVVAIKKLKYSSRKEDELKEIVNEIAVLQQCKHDNIIAYIG